MKRRLKKTIAGILTAALVFSVGVAPASAATAGAPAIKKVEYEGNGIVEVDFRGKIRYVKYKVTVKDLKGRNYAVKILERDNDEIKFRIVNYRKNHTYRFSIANIGNLRGGKLYTVSGKIGIEIKSNKKIGLDRAKQIAAGNVGLKANQIRFTKAKLDYENGRYVYEIEFKRGNYEYEYDILASTGKILSRSIEYDD